MFPTTFLFSRVETKQDILQRNYMYEEKMVQNLFVFGKKLIVYFHDFFCW